MSILLDRSASVLQGMVGLEEAILETLAYSDVFDYPLRTDEIHRYLPVETSLADVRAALEHRTPRIEHGQEYFFLAGRESVVGIRRRREAISRPALKQAIRIGRILGGLPFIRMVALTGSLAVLNSEQSGDLDYMLVTAAGRVWTARGFAVLLGRITARFGFVLCPNLVVSERNLEWRQHDLYSAREICQMIPITGADTYATLRGINSWTNEFLPNATGVPPMAAPDQHRVPILQSPMERLLGGRIGNKLEEWEMTRKVRRLSAEAGFCSETRFTADLCQGHFDHHGAQTRSALQRRLARLGLEPSPADIRMRASD